MQAIYCSDAHPIVKELIKAGIISSNSRKWTLVAEVGQPLRAVSEVLVTEDEFRKVADSLLAHRGHLDSVTTYKSAERAPDDPGITKRQEK